MSRPCALLSHCPALAALAPQGWLARAMVYASSAHTDRNDFIKVLVIMPLPSTRTALGPDCIRESLPLPSAHELCTRPSDSLGQCMLFPH